MSFEVKTPLLALQFLKVATFCRLIIITLVIITNLLNLSQGLQIELLINCYIFYHYYIGFKCSRNPTLLNLNNFRKSSSIIWIFYIIVLIFLFLAMNAVSFLLDSINSMKIVKITLNPFIVYYIVIFCVWFAAVDYTNYIIVNLWIYITLQNNVNQHPPPHLYDYQRQLELLNGSIQLGPGRFFNQMSTLLLFVIQLISPYVTIYYGQGFYRFIGLPITCIFIYNYGTGLRAAFSPTISKLHKLKQTSKIALISIILYFIERVSNESSLQNNNPTSGELEMSDLITAGIISLIKFAFFCGLAFPSFFCVDFANYIIAWYQIYITLQNNANNHPPPHMFDYENQYDVMININVYPNVSSQIAYHLQNRSQVQQEVSRAISNNLQNRSWVQLAQDNSSHSNL